MQSKMDHALALVVIYSVMPIGPDKKDPSNEKGVPRYRWRNGSNPNWPTTNPERIKTHWYSEPQDNPAIATGHYNGAYLFAVDVDKKNGKRGDETLRALEAKYGPLPKTYKQSTPTGGWHLLFRSPEPVRQGVNVLGPGLDIRCVGGYVLAAGSEIEQGTYTTEEIIPPALAPDWLIELCGKAAEKTPARAKEIISGVDAENATARAEAYLADEAPAGVDGARNDTAYKVAARVKDFGVGRDDCLALMREHWKCDPPLEPDELAAVVPSAYRYGREAQGSAAPEVEFNDGTIPPEAPSNAKPKRPPFDPNVSRIGDIFTVPPPPPRFIVRDLYPVACGQENSIGGLGKTTRRIWEAVHLILGRPLYGRPILQSGPVLIVTKEDGADIFRYRIHRVALAMNLSPAEQKRIADSLHVLDLTGDVGARLAAVNREGNLYATDLAERICTGYRQEGLAQVSFDPWNAFGPGERFVNDAEAALLAVGASISRELACNTCYVGHVSKVVARQGIIDAHSGRGGSAMGDNARFVLNYVPHDPKDDAKAWPAPATGEPAAAQGSLFRLHITKQSYAKRPVEPVWIERQGYTFTVHEGAPASPTARLEADGERLKLFVQQEMERGIYYVSRPLEEQHDRYGMGRNKARQVISWLISAGGLIERELPEGARRKGSTRYLHPVLTQTPETPTGDPFQ